eukprot:1066968_1
MAIKYTRTQIDHLMHWKFGEDIDIPYTYTFSHGIIREELQHLHVLAMTPGKRMTKEGERERVKERTKALVTWKMISAKGQKKDEDRLLVPAVEVVEHKRNMVRDGGK